MYSSSALVLNQILPLIQDGPLKGSTYRLEAVQSKKYINITRYFLLYQIISSYSSEYISKRAVVDYDEFNQNSTIVDWSQITYESDFTVISSQDLQISNYQSLLSGFSDLYPTIESLENYKVSSDSLALVKEYRVLHYNHSSNIVNLKLFYKNGVKTVLLVDENDEISTFKPYKKTYATLN
jgi:sulfur relay (sulfurtransferase) DsrF/TusC family protein